MPSNSYGFDFLANQHRSVETEENGGGYVAQPQESHYAGLDDDERVIDVSNKPDLEKQFDILAFLKQHREACIAPSLIYRSTGIDLERRDIAVANMLAENPKIRLEVSPDPENPSLNITLYAYQSKYPSVRDRSSLLAQVNRMPTGVRVRDLADSYTGIEEDIAALITAGEVIAAQNSEERDSVLFPRGEQFLVELDGLVSMPSGAAQPVFTVSTDVDPQQQIRRGEAIQVGGEWFRVSSAVKEGVPLSEQPGRAQAPLSVTSLKALSDKNAHDGYIRPFGKDTIPLDGSLSDTGVSRLQAARKERGAPKGTGGSYAQRSNQTKRSNNKRKSAATTDASKYSHALRHGCTLDVRNMFLETRSLVPESDQELQRLLIQNKLLEPGEKMRRNRLKVQSNVDPAGKTKKRRYYVFKNQRQTNTHLQGTEIGALLAIAQEKQKMGKSVGDGGM